MIFNLESSQFYKIEMKELEEIKNGNKSNKGVFTESFNHLLEHNKIT